MQLLSENDWLCGIGGVGGAFKMPALLMYLRITEPLCTLSIRTEERLSRASINQSTGKKTKSQITSSVFSWFDRIASNPSSQPLRSLIPLVSTTSK